MAHVFFESGFGLTRFGDTHRWIPTQAGTTHIIPASLMADNAATFLWSLYLSQVTPSDGDPYLTLIMDIGPNNTSRDDMSAQFESAGHILIQFRDMDNSDFHFVIPTDFVSDISESYRWIPKAGARRTHWAQRWSTFLDTPTNRRESINLGLWDGVGDTPTWHPSYVAPVVTAVSSFRLRG